MKEQELYPTCIGSNKRNYFQLSIKKLSKHFINLVHKVNKILIILGLTFYKFNREGLFTFMLIAWDGWMFHYRNTFRTKK